MNLGQVCLGVLSVLYVQSLWRPEEGAESPGTGTRQFVSHPVGLEIDTESAGRAVTEPSLWSPKNYYQSLKKILSLQD